MADSALTTNPSRRHVMAAVAVIPAACIAAPAAIANPLSPAIRAAFDRWQQALAHYELCDRFNDEALARMHEILPQLKGWTYPLTDDQKTAAEAAYELSGHKAADAVAEAALDRADDMFGLFLETPPETMADVRFQASHLVRTLSEAVDPPVVLWLETISKEGSA